MCPSGLHGPGQFPGRVRVLQLRLGDFCEGLSAPSSILLLLLQRPPRQHPRASVPKGGSTGQLVQHRGQRWAWGGAGGWEDPGVWAQIPPPSDQETRFPAPPPSGPGVRVPASTSPGPRGPQPSTPSPSVEPSYSRAVESRLQLPFPSSSGVWEPSLSYSQDTQTPSPWPSPPPRLAWFSRLLLLRPWSSSLQFPSPP